MSSLKKSSPATALVERFLKIPPEPAPPAGTHEAVQTFRAAKGFYHYQLFRWGVKQVAAVIGLIFGFLMVSAIPDFPYKFLLDILEMFAVLTFLISLLVTYLMVHLDYQLRWYIVTDRSLRIREGVVHVNEKIMSFANIQNLSVQQGPLQRLLGIADVEVRTAGGGNSTSGHKTPEANMHLGYFRGVDNAEEIRDAVLARVRQLRDSGLGDPDSLTEALPNAIADREATAEPEVLVAAHQLLAEMRALRTQAPESLRK